MILQDWECVQWLTCILFIAGRIALISSMDFFCQSSLGTLHQSSLLIPYLYRWEMVIMEAIQLISGRFPKKHGFRRWNFLVFSPRPRFSPKPGITRNSWAETYIAGTWLSVFCRKAGVIKARQRALTCFAFYLCLWLIQFYCTNQRVIADYFPYRVVCSPWVWSISCVVADPELSMLSDTLTSEADDLLIHKSFKSLHSLVTLTRKDIFCLCLLPDLCPVQAEEGC